MTKERPLITQPIDTRTMIGKLKKQSRECDNNIVNTLHDLIIEADATPSPIDPELVREAKNAAGFFNNKCSCFYRWSPTKS